MTAVSPTTLRHEAAMLRREARTLEVDVAFASSGIERERAARLRDKYLRHASELEARAAETERVLASGRRPRRTAKGA